MNRTACLLAVCLALASTGCGGPVGAPLGQGKQGAAQALFQAVRPASAAPSEGVDASATLKGRASGTASVTAQVSVVPSADGGTVTVRKTIKFVNFSEDGKTFYDGSLAVDVLVQGSSAGGLVKYAAKGRVELSGEVSDYLDADVAIEVEGSALSRSSGSASVKLAGAVTTSAGKHSYSSEAFDLEVSASLPTQKLP